MCTTSTKSVTFALGSNRVCSFPPASSGSLRTPSGTRPGPSGVTWLLPESSILIRSPFCFGSIVRQFAHPSELWCCENSRQENLRKRAALKKRPEEDQEAYAQRQRAYRAAYREKNAARISSEAAKRRRALFIEKFGRQAFLAKRRTRFKKRVEQELRAGVRVLRYANVDEEVEDIMEGDSDFETALAQ
ncbi:hypothetical protein DFH07DRAFT_947510 [Mycena maculata]|uniref:Uncharacterized protein n=1 Tax=Mycena maculata TaxID=230809 RepID=A0AAD7HC28_9AGAR|nr:hypothetical protein DFH07DRAFT_947510 [Mycena maculata]